MNKEKLNGYSLTGSIHTISVKAPGLVEDIQDTVDRCIAASSRDQAGEKVTTAVVNPNKLAGDIFTFTEFGVALETILAGAGIDEYHIVRADMRFDSYDPEHYRAYEKLNRYLISALATAYKVKNCYRSTDLFSQEQLSVAIKNRYFEAENYDKAAESGGADQAMSRLEERSKSWTNNDIRAEFCERWFRRWDKALKNLDAVQRRYNDELERIYLSDKDSYPCKFRSLTDFLIRYEGCIFTKKQMINLLARFPEVGPERAKTRAENHKKRYGIEYFSRKDVTAAVDEIRRATL